MICRNRNYVLAVRGAQESLLEAAALPSVFTLGKEPFVLGKEPFVLGKGFAECSTRQSPLGKIFLGKWSLPSAFIGALGKIKNNFAECLGRHSAKYFRPLRRRLLTVILPSALPSTRQFFFKLLCRVPQPRHSAKFFFIFFKKLLYRVPQPRHSAKFFF